MSTTTHDNYNYDDILTPLFDSADTLSKQKTPSVPNFPIPAGFDTTGSKSMELRRVEGRGMGWYAKKDLTEGTFVLVSKPMAMVMCWEEDDSEEEEEEFYNEEEGEEEEGGSKRNGMLVIKLIRSIRKDPSLWFDHLTKLFPRVEDLPNLPKWKCRDEKIDAEIHTSLRSLSILEEFNNDEDLMGEVGGRLPSMVKYNCHSVETSPELFVHPDGDAGGHVNLSGTGLYELPSFFNHDHDPNVLRWSLGDVMFCVTNRLVRKGEELCISYIESEVLCESGVRRTRLLDMDFTDGEGSGEDGGGEGEVPVVDFDVQQELMEMHPLERLHELNDLLKQATGEGVGADDGDGVDGIDRDSWFKCDVHNLRILLAMTLESLDQGSKAMEQWELCIQFVDEHFPVGDENGVALRVQAALCALSLSKESHAKTFALDALRIHNMTFGGGVVRFRRRYTKEVELPWRSKRKDAIVGVAALDVLWPV